MVQQALVSDAQGIIDLINSEKEHLLLRSLEEVENNIASFAVIKDEGKIVACASFEDYAPKIAEIRSVVVHHHYRKKGYGEKLINHLLDRAKPKQEVFVVTGASKFFKKIGFGYCLNSEKEILFYQKK